MAVAKAPRGSALVVDVGRVPDRGYWGEVLTTAAEARDIAGLVIDGGVRDTAALAAHGFAVFSSTVSLPGATKVFPGTVGLAVRVGGVDVEPGDWVVGDGDGVVVIPGAALDDVLAAGKARADKEAVYFAQLAPGATTVDLLGLDTSPVREGSGCGPSTPARSLSTAPCIFSAVLVALLGRSVELDPATLADHRVVALAGCRYPGLVRSPGDVVAGWLCGDLAEDEWAVIDAWEDDFYELVGVEVTTAAGDRHAGTYRLTPGTEGGGPWSAQAFAREALESYVADTRAWRRSWVDEKMA